MQPLKELFGIFLSLNSFFIVKEKLEMKSKHDVNWVETPPKLKKESFMLEYTYSVK